MKILRYINKCPIPYEWHNRISIELRSSKAVFNHDNMSCSSTQILYLAEILLSYSPDSLDINPLYLASVAIGVRLKADGKMGHNTADNLAWWGIICHIVTFSRAYYAPQNALVSAAVISGLYNHWPCGILITYNGILV